MNIIKETAEALKPILQRGIEVSKGWYEKSIPFPYIKLWYLSGEDDEPSDDGFESQLEMIQITVFSKVDSTELISEVIQLMKAHGFTYITRNSDTENVEEKTYMYSARFELSM